MVETIIKSIDFEGRVFFYQIVYSEIYFVSFKYYFLNNTPSSVIRGEVGELGLVVTTS